MMSESRPSESERTGRGWAPAGERSLDEQATRNWWESGPEWRTRGRRAGYVAAIVVNAVLLYVAHHLLAWQVPFVTPYLGDVLWAIDLSLTATILANAVYLAYDARWFRSLTQLGLSGLAFVVAAILYAIFPFDFGTATWNELAHLGLLLVMVALIIAMIVQAVVFLTDVIRRSLAR